MTDNKKEMRGVKEITQQDVVLLFRDVVDKSLKTKIHLKDIMFL
jgi:hypothetical protein